MLLLNSDHEERSTIKTKRWSKSKHCSTFWFAGIFWACTFQTLVLVFLSSLRQSFCHLEYNTITSHYGEMRQYLVSHAVFWNDELTVCVSCGGLGPTRGPWSHSTRPSAVESGIWQRRLSRSSVSIISRTPLRSSKRCRALKLPMKGEVGDWQSNTPLE